MKRGFWKLIIVLCVVGSFAALCSYSWAKTHTPLRHVKEDRVKPVGSVSEQTAKTVQTGPKQFEYPFACNDLDNRCLTLLAETPRRKGEPKLKHVMVQAENGKSVLRWVQK